MKRIHIVLLVVVAAAIGVLISYIKASSTYDTIDIAMSKPGKFVHLIANIDRSQPVDYNPYKDANYLGFTATDSTGKSMKVVYLKGMPENFESAKRVVLEGKYIDGKFNCTKILPKCPSKYKEEAEKTGGTHPGNIPTGSNTTPAADSSKK